MRAVLPGTFDPPTMGHINVIERAAKFCDTLYVLIAVNEMKQCFFSEQERFDMMKDLLGKNPNVIVATWQGLVVDFCIKHDIQVILRGVRALADFGYEFELAMTNKQLNPDIDIMFLPTDPKYFVLRSSAIKEMAAYGADISKMVPPSVAKMMKKKLGV